MPKLAWKQSENFQNLHTIPGIFLCISCAVPRTSWNDFFLILATFRVFWYIFRISWEVTWTLRKVIRHSWGTSNIVRSFSNFDGSFLMWNSPKYLKSSPKSLWRKLRNWEPLVGALRTSWVGPDISLEICRTFLGSSLIFLGSSANFPVTIVNFLDSHLTFMEISSNFLSSSCSSILGWTVISAHLFKLYRKYFESLQFMGSWAWIPWESTRSFEKKNSDLI